MTHTPGQWRVETGHFNLPVIVDTEGEQICVMSSDDPVVHSIVAAAPDLLEALKKADTALELAYQHCSEMIERDILKAQDAVRSAIAEAEGRA